MLKSLNKLGFVGALCLLTFPAFARVCFLPDAADCKSGNTKYSYKDDNVGCEFKSKSEADAKIGKNECQEAYQSGVCYYIRCKDDMRAAEVPDEHKLYMGSEKDCLAQAHERTHGKTGVKKKCVPCAGGCWKLEDSSIGPDIYHTCKEMGYVVKDSCKADYLKFEPISLVDKNGDTCGNCAKLTCSQMGGYKTKDTCAADEEFEAVDKIDAYSNICGNCKKTVKKQCSDYGNILMKEANCKGTFTQDSTHPTDDYGNKCGTCMIDIKPTAPVTVTITYQDKSNKIKCNIMGEPDKCYYYNTLKFNAVFSDKSTHKVKLMTHASISCQTEQYKISNVTKIDENGKQVYGIYIDENTEAIYRSACDINDNYIQLDLVDVHTYIDGKEIDVNQVPEYTNGGKTFNDALKEQSKTIDNHYTIVYKPEDSAQTCSDYGLKKSSECGTGYTFTQDSTHPTDDNGDECGTCERALLTKPTITIYYTDTQHDCSYGTPCYYSTIKFTAVSSDGIYRTVNLKTYPDSTCKTYNVISSPVNVAENTETTYASTCGDNNQEIRADTPYYIDTFVNGKRVDRRAPLVFSFRSGLFKLTLGSDTVTTDDYIIKYVNGTAPIQPSCASGNATIEYAYCYYYKCGNSNCMASYCSGHTPHPIVTYTNGKTENLCSVSPKTNLEVATNKTYEYVMSYGAENDSYLEVDNDDTNAGGVIQQPIYNINDSSNISKEKFRCSSMLMTKADYTKATGNKEGGMVNSNSKGTPAYYGDTTFQGVSLLNEIACSGEYVLVYGCEPAK